DTILDHLGDGCLENRILENRLQARLNSLVNLSRQRIQGIQAVLQFRMSLMLFSEIFSQLVAEGLISQNAVTDVRDEVEAVAEIVLNLFSLRFLLANAINLVQQ